jgi:hypothetical protein
LRRSCRKLGRWKRTLGDQLTLRLVVADVTLSKCVFVAVIFISLYTLTFLTIVAVTDSLTNRLQHWLLDWVPASGRYIGCLVGCLRLERAGRAKPCVAGLCVDGTWN